MIYHQFYHQFRNKIIPVQCAGKCRVHMSSLCMSLEYPEGLSWFPGKFGGHHRPWQDFGYLYLTDQNDD